MKQIPILQDGNMLDISTPKIFYYLTNRNVVKYLIQIIQTTKVCFPTVCHGNARVESLTVKTIHVQVKFFPCRESSTEHSNLVGDEFRQQTQAYIFYKVIDAGVQFDC
jgi:hypothetical protein